MVRNNNDELCLKAELVKRTAIFLTIELGRSPNQKEIQDYINKTMHKKLSRNDLLKIMSFNEKGGFYQ